MNSNEKDSRGILAIVSPCSTCKNKNAFPVEDKDGKIGNKFFCPRLHWKEVKNAMESSNDNAVKNNAQYLRHLVLTGTDDDKLTNPISDKDGGSILVWVANIQDNEDIRDAAGKIISPSILSGEGSFQTERIVCSSLPFVPENSSVEYNQAGRLEEWSPVLTTSLVQQIEEGTDNNAHYGGTVKRTGLLYNSGQVSVFDHKCPEGQ